MQINKWRRDHDSWPTIEGPDEGLRCTSKGFERQISRAADKSSDGIVKRQTSLATD